jgi:hypothetical protein
MVKTQTRKSTEIVMPEMKLRLADLTYLAALASGQSCQSKDSVRDKCLFLGLIAQGEIPPSPKKVKEYLSQSPVLLQKVVADFKAKNWLALGSSAYALGYHFKRIPVATKGVILTKTGKDVVLKSRAAALTAKSGCL